MGRLLVEIVGNIIQKVVARRRVGAGKAALGQRQKHKHALALACADLEQKKQQAANAYSAHAARGRLAERGVSRNIGKGLGVVNSAAFAQLPQEAVGRLLKPRLRLGAECGSEKHGE